MEKESYNQLELREIFHLEFLRWLGRKLKPANYALKGGVNLRFFFNSFRYSQDMDLDAYGIRTYALKEEVMKILEAPSFQDSLKTFGIDKITPPDISKAKQTETTQRFKIHLLTASGEDLFTRVEFSRRGFRGDIAVQPVLNTILHTYKLPPLLCPHYTVGPALLHKIEALALRSAIQARDVFDLYILIPQAERISTLNFSPALLERARGNSLEISFSQFRDTVLSYLAPEDRRIYDKASVWDEIKLKVSEFIEKGKNNA